uniref:NIPSNAP domain-containing protein n=1 Tax=Plectus sambesii TaxID=2011161 RepID=A0A914XHS9_9BILA
MIEWGNSWAKGITYRREHSQDVGGFFAQVGQLYVVFHLWAYKDLVARKSTREHSWSKPGWDTTVAYTVPLINKMESKIMTATSFSQLK